MKITFKKEYIDELQKYNHEDSWIIHPEFKINIGMIDDIYEVLWICMENDTVEYITYEPDFLYFDFFDIKYFDIIDTRIPDTWCIWGFPKNFPFQYTDGTYGRAEYSSYYWGLPIFFSDYFWLWNYYDWDPDCKEKQEFRRYLELSKEGVDMEFAKEDCDIDATIELIKKLP